MNRLSREKSPYLLQHAANPVDWYPWGDEAFRRARDEDKPVFLSIGYSTCHWCHVMAHESFEDEGVAALLNEHFVPVKVDREERPDIDAVYMDAAYAMTGAGGWPLTIVTTPEGRPFFAATYVPRTSRFGSPGLLELLPRIAELWKSRKNDLVETGGKVLAAIQQMTEHEGLTGAEAAGGGARAAAHEPAAPLADTMKRAYRQLASRFDPEHGGFGDAPKFPTPHQLFFLLRYWRRTGETTALAMVERTLREMNRGGIHDHIGHGFHRYSTDAAWHLPHFEKMLYDQALISIAYTEAFQATGFAGYRSAAEHTLHYVMDDMTDVSGAFCSAEDADSEGVEGKFYTWTFKQIREAVGEDDAAIAARVFGLAEEGNLPGDAGGLNVLNARNEPASLARELGLSEDDLAGRVEKIRGRLLEARSRRVRPSRDDKVLADWNGLMIAALARASRAFEEPSYAEAAGDAADFILETMRGGDEDLLHRYRDGEAAIPGNAADHAFLAMGLFDLYEATFDAGRLRASLDLTERMLSRFWDQKHGGFFFTAADGEHVLVNRKDFGDGAVPSSNAIALLNLLRLGDALGRPDLTERADALTRLAAPVVTAHPSGYTMFLTSLDYAVGPSSQVVIAGDRLHDDTGALIRETAESFLPNTVILLNGPSADLTSLAPWTAEYRSVDGKAAAYVCSGRACALPVTDASDLRSALRPPRSAAEGLR